MQVVTYLHNRLRRAQHELVAIRIGEDGGGTPVCFGRLLDEADTACGKLPVGRLDVVSDKRDAGEGPDPALLPRRREQDDSSARASDPELDPALLIIEGLV